MKIFTVKSYNDGFRLKTLIVFFLIFNIGFTQDSLSLRSASRLENGTDLEINQHGIYSVQWLSQFPVFKGDKEISNRGLLSKIIFGKKNVPEIIKPVDIIAMNLNEFYVLDQGSGTIFNIKNNNKKIFRTLVKSKINFPSLVSLCMLPSKEILFTDSRLNKIYKFNEEQKKLVVLNNNITLNQPTGIAYSRVSKEIWVVETAKHRISILDVQGNRLKIIGKRGTGLSEFNFPTAIYIDNSGNAYVIDAMNFRIQVFNKEGELISVFGEHGDASGYLARPKGIATDSSGNIYVTDALYNTVQVFDISGNFLYNFGEQGRAKEQFWMPSGIYIDTQDHIYISDSFNSRIQIFKLIKGE